MERILCQLSKAINDPRGFHNKCNTISHALSDLIKLENRPQSLTEMAYRWCSAICENGQTFWDWESLLLVCLEIGFRQLDPRDSYIKVTLTHTEHHRKLVGVVFKSRKIEAIADLLHAWTVTGLSFRPVLTSLGLHAEHLVGLHNLVPFSPRLRRLVIRFVELTGYKGFEGVGVEGFTELLNLLHVTDDDMDEKTTWPTLLLDTLQSSEGVRRLSHWYWELLAELTAQTPPHAFTYNPLIMTFLIKAQEWSKLECWMGTLWMALLQRARRKTVIEEDSVRSMEKDLTRSMLLLFCQQPETVKKLEQWMEQGSRGGGGKIPKSFRRVWKQIHEEVQRDVP